MPQPRRSDVSGDSSFEYATDRESSVYNSTTVPLRTSKTNDFQGNAAADNGTKDLLTRGNQIGIPESRFSRWLPKDQREIIEKQAKLLSNRTDILLPQMPTVATKDNLSPSLQQRPSVAVATTTITTTPTTNTNRLEHMTASSRPQLTETEI